MADYKKFSDIPSEQIEEWKNKYKGMVSLLEVEMNDEDDISDDIPIARFIVRRPSRNTMDAVGELGVKREITKANKALITNCVLGGDMEVLDSDGSVYAAVIDSLERMMTVRKRSLKKL